MRLFILIGLSMLSGLMACSSSNFKVDSVPVATAKIWHDTGRVVFVDAREAEEFSEAHIPGALNLTLRSIPHLSKMQIEQLAKAEHIVAYCLKDFRGFEVAKTLAKRLGKTTYIMQPYGINGWKAAGFPVRENLRKKDHL